ncbi:LacI family DNA-binding transcriptional regulator [Limosilactobacillus fermentum]|uniref:LacI family DNA-binding transcriptional regulator n=1 Tax=Limosilactobacillus fermentum TaxID=1613 RepID=UPI001C0085B7|nr:LacI family DNA-binding transcriptional regulator [Limosilactobacillus fermentum]
MKTKRKKKRPTIRDVAALSGVSVATVSRYLNGKTNKMTSATAGKIKEAITKLQYIPNSAAREMSHNKSMIIVIVVANVADYFSTEIFKGVSRKLEPAGYVPVLLDSSADHSHEQKILNSVNIHGFDGMLFQPLTSDTELIKSELTRNFPVVILDRELKRSPWPQVVTDNYQASRNATDHFVDEGFSHVVVLSSTIKQASTRQERFQGVIDRANDVDVIEIDEGHFDHQEVYQRLAAVMQTEKKTVLFSLKERWLLEFLPRLMQEGLISKTNTRVTGFADTSLIKSICPDAYMISQNPSYMGERAAEVLLKMLDGDNREIDDIVIKAQFDTDDDE